MFLNAFIEFKVYTDELFFFINNISDILPYL